MLITCNLIFFKICFLKLYASLLGTVIAIKVRRNLNFELGFIGVIRRWKSNIKKKRKKGIFKAFILISVQRTFNFTFSTFKGLLT